MLFVPRGDTASQCPQRELCYPRLPSVAKGHQPLMMPRVTPPTPAAGAAAGHAAPAVQSLEAAAAARVEEEEDVDPRGVPLLRGCHMRHLPAEILETVLRMAVARIHRLFVPRMRLRLLLRRREQLTQEARRQARWLTLAEGDLARNAARRFLIGVPPGALARLLRVEQGCVEGYPPGASVVLPACDLNRSLMIVFEGSLVVRSAGQRRKATVHATAAVGDFFIASPLSSINVGVRAGNERAFVIHIPFSRFEGLCADLPGGRASGGTGAPQTALDASVLGLSFSTSVGGFHAPPHATAAVPAPPTCRPTTDASPFAGLSIARPSSPFRSDHVGIGPCPHPPSALRSIASGGARSLGAAAADAAPTTPPRAKGGSGAQALLVAKALNVVSIMEPRSPAGGGGGGGLRGRCSAAAPAPGTRCPPDRRKSALANALEQYMRLTPRKRSREDGAGWHAQASARLDKLHPPTVYPPAAAEHHHHHHHQRRGSGGGGPPKSPTAAAAAACWEQKQRQQQRRQPSAHRRRRRRRRHCRHLFAETRMQVAAEAEAGRRKCEEGGEGDCDWLPPVGVDPDHLCYRRGRRRDSAEAGDPPSLERQEPVLEILSHAAFDPQSATVVFTDDDDF